MPASILIYSASAGSGKTFNLAARYISLLVEGRDPRLFARTLAVTFTNKATAEMKDRILEQLYGIAHSLPESDSYLQSVRSMLGQRLTDEEIRARCKEALSTILHDYSHFSVSTIDAFFQSVLRNMAHELGLNARLQVDISNDEVTELAIENLLGRPGVEDGFFHWLMEYVEESVDEGNKWDVRSKLKGMARRLFEEKYLRRRLDPEHNKAFNVENVRSFKAGLLEEKNRLPDLCATLADQFDEELQATGYSYEDITWGKDLGKYIGLLRQGEITEAKLGERVKAMINAPKEKLTIGRGAKKTSLPNAEHFGSLLSDIANAQREANSMFIAINLLLGSLSPLGTLEAISEEIRDINKENNRFSLAHTPILLREMVKGDDAPFVFEKTGTRYDNVMIDEFQDTSSLQWDNFQTLLTNNSSEGGLNMVVGDVKQSIYRWRNGDWHILQQLLSDPKNKTISLKTNWRSRGNIISFNNGFFTRAAALLDSITSGTALQDLYKDVAQQAAPGKEKGGYVRVRIRQEERYREEIAASWRDTTLDDLCKQIKLLHEESGVPYKEMAILVRRLKDIPPIASRFSREDPPLRLVSDEAFRLGTSTTVNIIVDALRVLQAAKLSPSDVTLRTLILNYQCDVLRAKGRSDTELLFAKPETLLPEEFVSGIRSLGHLPLGELCERLYRIFRLSEARDQDAYLLSFFDELEAFVKDNTSDPQLFLRHWDESMRDSTIPAGEVDGIRVLTIHKAKGLQFHTVFCPGFDFDITKYFQNDYLWCDPQTKPLSGLGVLPVRCGKGFGDSAFSKENQQEQTDKRADALNLLYVAFTRAEQNLFVWSKARPNVDIRKSNFTVGELLLSCLDFSGEVYTVGKTAAYVQPQRRQASENKISPTPTPERIGMLSLEGSFEFRQSKPSREYTSSPERSCKREQTNLFDLPSAAECRRRPGTADQPTSYIERGNLLHKLFSLVGTKDDTHRAVSQLLSEGIISGGEEARRLEAFVTERLQAPDVADWFSGGYDLMNERDIISLQDGKLSVKRPDRVMLKEGKVVVVDFKFGKSRPEYRQQVAEYVRLLRSMRPDCEAEGYLWYVFDNKTEQV
ncbi:MAG: UvrD-helicase domain-containing protein [Prevotellaceae bacterium]|nr:UvrD-helicase domain-containing protein [Prevotellaceae bacterium]